jgi:mannuronan 5-epimerase
MTILAFSLGNAIDHTPQDDDDYAYALPDSCMTYSSKSRLISITCNSVRLSDIDKHLNNSSIITRENNNSSDTKSKEADVGDKIWILKAGIIINENASLIIDSNDTKWLKIVPVATKQLVKSVYNTSGTSNEISVPNNSSDIIIENGETIKNDDNVFIVSKNNGDNPNGIHVFGSLKIDSVKITSWNLEDNDVIKFDRGKRQGEEHTKSRYDTAEPRPFIRVSAQATGTTNITNSEIAYLGYSCSRCSGLSYYGGVGSVIKGNDIHHLLKGYYSNGMGHMVIEDNRFYDNYLYGIDPHTGSHDIIIRNNIIHDNNASGIICSKDCYGLLIEGNKVFDNGGVGRGIAFSINTSHSVARNNEVYNQNRCIAFNRESNYNEVYDNKVSHCTTGVSLANTSENQIHDNNIAHSENGIVLKDINNSIYGNTIRDTENAVVFINASNNESESLDNFSNITLKPRQPNYSDFFDKVSRENKMVDVEKKIDIEN